MPFVYKKKNPRRWLWLPVTLLVLWMAGSTWYWTCVVKLQCEGSVAFGIGAEK